jgi:hypothetical protein
LMIISGAWRPRRAAFLRRAPHTAAALDAERGRPGAPTLPPDAARLIHCAWPPTERAWAHQFGAANVIPPNLHDRHRNRGCRTRVIRFPVGRANSFPGNNFGSSTWSIVGRANRPCPRHRSGPRIGQVVPPGCRRQEPGATRLSQVDDDAACRHHRNPPGRRRYPEMADHPGHRQWPGLFLRRSCSGSLSVFRQSRRRHRNAVGDQTGGCERRRRVGFLRIDPGRQRRVREYQFRGFRVARDEPDAVHDGTRRPAASMSPASSQTVWRRFLWVCGHRRTRTAPAGGI